jgi:hypothetical protein
MAELNTGDGGGGKVRKSNAKVDLTAMVDSFVNYYILCLPRHCLNLNR